MLRKLIASAALGLASVSTLAAPSVARADHWEHRHHRHYEVLYRRDCHCEWRCKGRFDCLEDAEHVAHRLRHHGFEVMIRD